MGLMTQSGTAQWFGIGSKNTTSDYMGGSAGRQCAVQQLANLGLGQENKHRKYLRLMKTMGSLLLFKEVFLGQRNRHVLLAERDLGPVQTRGRTFIDFSWARISFQMVLVLLLFFFPQDVISPF